ncbi:conserved protein of unknown function [Ruminococcaceae bacterium BL-4]|jgi:hypothetical protein|nr:conserved protein of unknown function [Ruminococcaceae bacterium BL-4]
MIIECNYCTAFVEAEEIGIFEYLRNGNIPSGRYVFLKCKKCGSPMLIKQDNIGNLAEGDIWDIPVKIYPAEDFHANPNAPKQVRIIYEEACRCFKAHAYIATAILSRKTVESICDYHGIKERTLANSLAKMKLEGKIDERLYDWADMLRLVGNEAAHDIHADVSKEDAGDILNFTNAIIEYIFSINDKFVEFKKRRQDKE